MMTRSSTPPFASVYLFPLAALYAAFMLPWSVLGQLGWVTVPPGLVSGLGHAHEMLFGFALLVVAGYVLGPRPLRHLLALMGVWLMARITFLCWPTSWLAAVFNGAFVVTLVWLVAPTYLRTAKKWRNKSVAFILLGLMLAVLAFHGLYLAGGRSWLYPVLLEAVLLLSVLMYFMGGRMLAPAMAGHLQSRQLLLKDRVQPRIEGGVLILLALVLVSILLPGDVARWITALLLFASALFTLTRMLRWRIWHCLGRADLLALLTGYAWLVVGWSLIGVALLTEWPLTSALHAITVGALGTLTLSVMARTRLHRVLKDPNALPWFYLTAVLMGAVALLRIGAHSAAMLVLAAAGWILTYLCLFVLLLYLRRVEKSGRMQDVRRKMKPALGRSQSE